MKLPAYQLAKILDLYKKWLNKPDSGKPADLSGAILYRANLSGAILYRADLSKASLYRTDFSKADLSGADLYEANR